MVELIQAVADGAYGPWVIGVFGLAMLAIFTATAWSFVGSSSDARRYAPAESASGSLRAHRPREADSVDRLLLPKEKSERSQVHRMLHRAGFRAPEALRHYYVLRVGLAVGFAALALLASPFLPVGDEVAGAVGTSTHVRLGALALAVVVGFYGPMVVVRHRAASRQLQIQRGFPDALDLLQVMIQAGLGLDAALQRVSEEMRDSCPPLAEELHVVVMELRAGKSREQALEAFTDRVDLARVRAFVTVITQSLRYGTSIANALETFSIDMRNERMMAAEEKANQLPVKMSVVLVLLMLPAVVMVVIGPVVIRVIRVLAPNVP